MKGLRRFRYHVLIALAILVAYVAADLWWYRSGYSWAIARINPAPVDPFAAPASYRMPFAERATYFLSNRVFVDLAGRYREWNDPFRPRKDPEGHPYFLSGEPEFEAFSGPLRCMREPSLLAPFADPAPTSYRLTILSSFDPCVSYRLIREESGSPPQFRGVTVDSISGEISDEITIELAPELWDRCEALLNSPEIWNPPAEIRLLGATSPDGDSWLFEKSGSEGHQMVVLHSPDYLAEFLLDGTLPTEGAPVGNVGVYREILELLQSLSEETTSTHQP